jgi:hypothetical protein
MKIYEIEAGEKEPIAPEDEITDRLNHVIPLVQQHCTQSLHAMRETGKYLYRGIKQSPPLVFLGQSRNNRNPSASPGQFQRNVDAAFNMAGFKALRSNSIFVSSSISEAKNYSYEGVYLIFPVDGFSFTWSPRISDLYIDEYNIFDDYTKRTLFFREDDASPELLKEFLERSLYRNTDFTSAIESTNEIMISGKYYAIHSKYAEQPGLKQLMI